MKVKTPVTNGINNRDYTKKNFFKKQQATKNYGLDSKMFF